MSVLLSVISAVVASSVVAAFVSGYFADRTERRKQLREQRISIAGQFAGDTMTALARLRDYKPPTGPEHRNTALRTDAVERASRERESKTAIDKVRPLRGQIWMLFPGRSDAAQRRVQGPLTIADWAEAVVMHLRYTEEHCLEFWSQAAKLDEHEAAELRRIESIYCARYDHSKSEAWRALDEFTMAVADRLDVTSAR